MSTTEITRQQLLDAATDVEHIADLATSSELTAVDRLGNSKLTMVGALARLKYDVPVSYTSGLNITTATQTVDEGGIIYAVKPSSLPIASTPGLFDSDDWYPIQDPRGYIHKDSKAAMSAIAVASVAAGDIVETKYRSTAGDGGGGTFRWNSSDLSSAVTADSQEGVYIPPDSDATGASGAWVRQNVEKADVRWFGAKGDGTTDDYASILGAVDYLFYGNDPGGILYFPKTKDFYVMGTGIDMVARLFAMQGLTVSSGGATLPGGEIARNVTIGLQGDFSSIRTTSGFTGILFQFGEYQSFSAQQSIKYWIDGIEFVGPGSTGHAATAYGSPTIYTTTLDANKGTDDTGATCIRCENNTPGSQMTNTNIRQFNMGVDIESGFGLEYESGSIQYCNTGIRVDALYTNLNLGASLEIELCGVGLYNNGATNVLVDGTIIEANRVAILAWLAKGFQLDSVWFEGNNEYDLVIRGDSLSQGLPNRHINFRNCIGPSNVTSNACLIGLHLEDCFTGGGYHFETSTGAKFEDVIFKNCTKDALANGFDLSEVTVGGLVNIQDIKVIGRYQNATLANYGSREPVTLKGSTSTAIASVQPAFDVIVPNIETTARIEIKGVKKAGSAKDMRPTTFYYVGLVERAVDAATAIVWSTTESLVTTYTALGSNAPVAVATPTTGSPTGANDEEQTLSISFPTGTAAADSAETLWTVKVDVEVGDIRLAR